MLNSVSVFCTCKYFSKRSKFMEGNREFLIVKNVYCKFIHEKNKIKVLFNI